MSTGHLIRAGESSQTGGRRNDYLSAITLDAVKADKPCKLPFEQGGR